MEEGNEDLSMTISVNCEFGLLGEALQGNPAWDVRGKPKQ